jgi:crotonyl-CoA carboxylase/reductase
VDVIAARARRGAIETYHTAGSDAAGIVRAVGPGVTRVAIGDEVVVSCGQYPALADLAAGDAMSTASAEIWGYESNHGAFAEYSLVYEYQCHAKPAALSWEEAACFLLTAATAYHQLRGWPPHVVEAGDPVLIWGGAGGLGSAAIQIVRHFGGLPVAVVSSDTRADYCRRLGAVVLNRSGFRHWGPPPDPREKAAWESWMAEVRRFGAAIWDALGARRAPRIVLEHPGSDTMATSLYVCAHDGMVVTCGATSGYIVSVDVRFLWMRQKRLQGSHFASIAECEALMELVARGAVKPCLARIFEFDEIGYAHGLMAANDHPPGNVVIRVGRGSRVSHH